MNEIADFLRARYTEQRATAEAAVASSSMNWCPGDRFLSDSVTEVETGAAVVIGPWEHLDHDLRQHIAAHDPAAVLADLDAKLALLAELLAERHERNEEDHWYSCAALTDEEGNVLCFDESRAPGPCDCGRDARVNRRLRLLAQPFIGHPDYKGEEWAA
ncbi:DUF6221 family protein [Streptomyces zhihengii]|uniref:DUF6221 family protein n=1 Tax=Streptomyces zhihengii TaxID=1818004 RepID=UPI00363880F3